MSEQVATAVATKNQKLEFVDPMALTASGANRGRWLKGAPDQNEVARIAVSMLTDKQIQPIEYRKDGKAKIVVVGETRRQAGVMIVEGFTHNNVNYPPNPEFKLKAVELYQADDTMAFRHAVAENLFRKSTTVVDDAFNMHHLKTELGMKQREIAELYGCDPSEVSRKLTLVKLDDDTLMKIHTGEIAFNTGVELAKLPAAKRAEVLESTGGKLAEVKEVIREEKNEEVKKEKTEKAIVEVVGTAVDIEQLTPEQRAEVDSKIAMPAVNTATDTDNTGTTPTPKQPKAKSSDRTFSQVKEILAQFTGDETGEIVRVVASVFYAYATGAISAIEVDAKFKAIGQ